MTDLASNALARITAKKLAEKTWLVGWIFESQQDGEKMVRTLVDLVQNIERQQIEQQKDHAA